MRPVSTSKGDSPARLLYFVIKNDRVVYKTTVISKAMAKMLPQSILAVELLKNGRTKKEAA